MTTTLAPVRTYEVVRRDSRRSVYRVWRAGVLLGVVGFDVPERRQWAALRPNGERCGGFDGRHRAAAWLEARS